MTDAFLGSKDTEETRQKWSLFTWNSCSNRRRQMIKKQVNKLNKINEDSVIKEIKLDDMIQGE